MFPNPKALILAVIFLGVAIYAQPPAPGAGPAEPDTAFRFQADHRFAFVAIALPHRSLRNSKSLHNWPFFAFAAPMGWTSNFTVSRNFGKVSLRGNAEGSFALFGLGVKSGITLGLLHLLELGVTGNVGSSWNFGDAATSMGVFNPERKRFDQDFFMTEYQYGVRYEAGLMLPLMVFLPKSDWTKIMLRPNASVFYSGYTGAEDGEVWKAGGEHMVNGYSYQIGTALMYMLPFETAPMLMVSAGVRGFMHESDFDPRYKPYDPTFRTISVTPMLSLRFKEKWSGMVMVSFSRSRKYSKYPFESEQEILQECVGGEWGLNAVMFMLSRKFF